MPTHRKRGYVVFFKHDRGFGFLRGEDGVDTFVHRREIDRERLEADQQVEYEIAPSRRGPRAIMKVIDALVA